MENDDIFSEFDGLCLECLRNKISEFSKADKNIDNGIKKCKFCDREAIGQCLRCGISVCIDHAHVYTKYGYKRIHCDKCWTLIGIVSLICVLPLLIISFVFMLFK